ncbi:MAG: AroM family protein [Acidobacteriota bacterium]
METRIAFVTIGQSPREDIVPEIAQLLDPAVRILERGALDGLSNSEIQMLKPDQGDFLLVTRLRDGSSAVVGKRKILPFLRKQIQSLANEHVRLIALLCTAEFPRLGPREILLRPSELLYRSAVSLLKRGKLGVFVPLEPQKEEAKSKWQETGYDIVVGALNPYQKLSDQGKALERMRTKDVDLVVLDCFGYSLKTALRIRHILGMPVLEPRSVLASAIRESI